MQSIHWFEFTARNSLTDLINGVFRNNGKCQRSIKWGKFDNPQKRGSTGSPCGSTSDGVTEKQHFYKKILQTL